MYTYNKPKTLDKLLQDWKKQIKDKQCIVCNKPATMFNQITKQTYCSYHGWLKVDKI